MSQEADNVSPGKSRIERLYEDNKRKQEKIKKMREKQERNAGTFKPKLYRRSKDTRKLAGQSRMDQMWVPGWGGEECVEYGVRREERRGNGATGEEREREGSQKCPLTRGVIGASCSLVSLQSDARKLNIHDQV